MRRRSKQEAQPTDGMRSMWEFVFISQFLQLFQDKLDLVHLDVEELEKAFQEADNFPLFSVFAGLLRLLLARWDVRISNWQDTLRAELEKRDADRNPLEEADYDDLVPEDRILLLKYLIDYICDEDNEKFKELKEFKSNFLNPESEQPKSIGQDTQGYTYWYLEDLRLYREKTTKKGGKRIWETVCTTSEEWDNIIKSLQKNKEKEKNLHDYLQDELYPSIESLLKEHEKEKDVKNRKKSKSSKPKKDSSKEEERDALIKQEEETIEKMKQDEEAEKQRNIEIEHRKKGRRRKDEQEISIPGQDISQERKQTREEQDELEKRIQDEIEKEKSLISAEDIQSGLVPRTRRRCVIIREQTKKKKEWWEEEGIGSDLEEDDDIDSDSSDGPRRRKKKVKVVKSVELPGQLNRTYVFSTALANRAAEAVQQGRIESIVAFHRAQHTTSPYLRPEKERTFDPSNKSYEQQKAYFSQQYHQQGSMMPRGFSAVPGMHPDGNSGTGSRSGYNPAQWQQFQLQQQYLKERQQRQHSSSQVDDLSQILFGGPMNGNGQNPSDEGSFPRVSYPSRPGMTGQQGMQYSYPQRISSQQQSYQDGRTREGYRPSFPQGYTQQQQQQYFQRPRNLPQLHSPGAQSPSSDPLGANVRSPPPPYPGARTGESRSQHHMGNSPVAVPSPTSTGSPQTPLTPHTPRFPAAIPSPGEPAKPPFSPSNQQSTFSGSGGGSFAGAKRPSSESSGSETAEGRPGFIDLGSKGYQNAPSSQHQGYGGLGSFNQSPMDNRHRSEESKGPYNNHDNSLQSPTERTMASFESAQPNKSPFLPIASQATNQNSNAYSTSAASMPKSFSVESLTAPSAPLDQPVHPSADQQMGPYSGIYYQSKYQPSAMFGGQRYQYPSTIQHSGSFYNSQLSSNMYLDRGSMPVYPPGRESGL